ncbi:class A beta-lactamase [Terasakiella pusilla]|uniref:class A beta-lactamase n=1 Tax=Terasakiella pusilla TaxID=64973 RepID=UPI003AA9B846
MIHRYSAAALAALMFGANIMPAYAEAVRPTYQASIDFGVLQQQVSHIAARNAGNVGVAVRHLETGQSFYLNADVKFFMASTYKIPMAVRLLQMVDEGKLSLDDLITVRKDEYVKWSVIEERFGRGPVAISLSNLLELMMVLSDNTATDVLLRVVGGAEAVTAMLQSMDVQDMVVARGTKDLILDFANYAPLTKLVREDGLSFAAAWDQMTPEHLQAMDDKLKLAEADPSLAAYLTNDTRDKATPAAMVKFLEKVWSDNVLSDTSTQLLQEIMARCETGDARIKGKLPQGTLVMHKTGTLDSSFGVTNNAGVIQLPEGKGNLAIVVYTTNADQSIEFNEEIIADIAQAAYNYFVYTIVNQ